ncbi:peptidoglycan-binding domain-containing protein [Deinococcus aquaticus]|uniref:peptidoglycan-binding domain-containing protein n=1 Tax=Deinococcus aquaticus TaxID=328692 RepID=UPI003F470028
MNRRATPTTRSLPLPAPRRPALRAVALTLALPLLAAHAQARTPDLSAAATRTAAALNGVLRNCPASFDPIGTPGKQCVGAPGTTEQVRQTLTAALKADLYGVWRSRDDQRSVFNWLGTPGGFVYLRLQADPDGRAQTLIYLDLPPDGDPTPDSSVPASAPATPLPAPTLPAGTVQMGGVTLTPLDPPGAAQAARPAPTPPTPRVTLPAAEQATPAATAPPTVPAPASGRSARSLAPVPFSRPLAVQTTRLNGLDVLAVQNRLIRLMRPARPGQGDGWFGPVTAEAVRAFQQASALPVTGRVDRATWDRLFAPDARTFNAP